MDVMINEKELIKKRDQLKKELKNKKTDYKEKQNLLRNQEKQMKEQHEAYISLEEKCRKLQTLINEKKAGLNNNETKVVTEEDIEKLEKDIKELKGVHQEEKRKYKQMITIQENKIKELNAQMDTLTLEYKEKDKECRLNALKISELKRQIKLGAIRPIENGAQPKHGAIPVDPNIARGVEQMKRDMESEKVRLSSGNKSSQEVKKEEPDIEIQGECFVYSVCLCVARLGGIPPNWMGLGWI